MARTTSPAHRQAKRDAKHANRIMRAPEAPHVRHKTPGKRALERAKSQKPVLFVAPPINEIIRDIAAVVAKEIQCMRSDVSQGERLSTDAAVKLRNLVSSAQHSQEMQLKVVQDRSLTELTDEELLALREDADEELSRRARRRLASDTGTETLAR